MKGRFLKRKNLRKTILTNLRRAISLDEIALSKSKKHAEKLSSPLCKISF